MGRFQDVWSGLTLRKLSIVMPVSPLTVVFTTVDATLLCLGGMIGHGFHVTLAVVAQKYGIMSIFSFVVGGLLMIATAMCYAELSCLSPTTGNAYHYCYNTMGELVAFLVGWTMILSYSLGLITSSRYLSSFIDHNFFEDKIDNSLRGYLTTPILDSFRKINSHPDLISVAIILLVAGMTISLVKDSIIINDTLVGLNLLTIMLISIVYLYYISYQKTKNHLVPKETSTLSFMLDGSFVAHYCFTGYDTAVCLGEETDNPRVTVPKSLLISCKFAIAIYCAVVVLHCLTWPVDDTDPKGPFMHTMIQLKLSPTNWICALGGVIGHLSSAHASMFLLIRLLYAMSRDGLLFRIFGRINRNTNTPVSSIFMFTIFLGSLSMYLKNEYMWTLACASGNLSKQVIATCLLIRRYRCEDKLSEDDPANRWILFNYPRSLKTPSKVTERISMLLIGIAVLCMVASGLFFTIMVKEKGSHFMVRTGFMLCTALFIIFGYLLWLQPQNTRNIYYTVRGVPFLPLSIVGFHEVMILNFEIYPWKEMLIWLFLGVIFYMMYSYNHSVERKFLFPDGRRWSRMRSSKDIQRNVYIIPDTADPGYLSFMRRTKKRINRRLFHHDKGQKTEEPIEIPASFIKSAFKSSFGTSADRNIEDFSSIGTSRIDGRVYIRSGPMSEVAETEVMRSETAIESGQFVGEENESLAQQRSISDPVREKFMRGSMNKEGERQMVISGAISENAEYMVDVISESVALNNLSSTTLKDESKSRKREEDMNKD